ncbi:MAG: glycosyltransferase family 4 protein [Actinomycetota bacterium]
MDVPRTLVVTNDFPPKLGGVQTFVHALVHELPADAVAVLAPRSEDSAAFDAEEPYRIERANDTFLWPTRALADRVEALARDHAAEVVLFGSPVPLTGIGPTLAKRGLPYVTLAHGLEYWMSIAPGAHAFLRYGTSRASAVLVCSRYIARVVRTAVPRGVPVAALRPGVDPRRFRPGLVVDDLREELGVAGRPVVVCVSRLVPRKGQDVLIRAMGRIRDRVPDAVLVLVGGGTDRARLEALAASAPGGSVVFAGQVSEEELPRAYAIGDVFAMPCRDRFAGLEVEGWGIVFVEAAACGLPVVAGTSGGAPEAVIEGETGALVDGSDVGVVAGTVAGLLADPDHARAMGAAGRMRVERELSWERCAGSLAQWLRRAVFTDPGAPGG